MPPPGEREMATAIDTGKLAACPLFSGHGDEELADIAQYMRPVRAKAGSRLFTQGDPAEGLYVVEEGEIRIVSRLPGDKEVELGRIGPGELFGEVALVINSQHSTSAEVLAPFRGCFFSRMHFDMLRSDLRPSAFRTMNAITETICGRIRAQIAEIETGAMPAVQLPVHGTHGNGSAGPSGRLRANPSLTHPAQLRRLPVFRPYTGSELKRLLAPLRHIHLPRGTVLFERGAAPDQCWIVVRGALRVEARKGKVREQMGILGPSQLCGVLALMDGKPEPFRCEVREDADLLEMDRKIFEQIREAADPLAFKFFESVNAALVNLLRKNNRHVSLLAVQGRLVRRAAHTT